MRFLIFIFSITVLCPITLSAQEDKFLADFFHKTDSILQSKIGTLYPDFTATTLDGKTISDRQLIGRVTIINFWFEACAPCIAEFDALSELYHKFKDDSSFQFLSFTFEQVEDAKAIVQKFNIPYDVSSISHEECSSRLNFGFGFPTTIIINQSGKIVFIKHGGSTDTVKVAIMVQEFEQIIADLLAKGNDKNTLDNSAITTLSKSEIPDSVAQKIFSLALQEKDSINQSKIGTSYPNFTATTLDRKTISEKQLIGKVSLINFWFETCSPCVKEFGTLSNLFHKFKGNSSFQFISFTFDQEEDVKATLQKFNIPYDVSSITHEECYRLNFGNGFPTTFIIDQSGKIVFIKGLGKKYGIETTIMDQDFEQIIADLLAKNSDKNALNNPIPNER
jgi:peroxiredoxin